MKLIAVLVFLSYTSILPALDLRVPSADPTRVIEYSEREGAIVHIQSFKRATTPLDPAYVREMKQLIKSSLSSLNAGHARGDRRKNKRPAKTPSAGKPGIPGKSTTVKRKIVDYSKTPNEKDEIMCPDPHCKAWNPVTARFCRVCGGELADTPAIAGRRKQIEEAKRLYGQNTQVEDRPEPGAVKPVGPSYGEFGPIIKQLGTEFHEIAARKLKRDAIRALPDLSLALKDPDILIQRRLRLLLQDLMTESNGNAMVRALRDDKSRIAAMTALSFAGKKALNPLFHELESANPASSSCVVELLGRLGPISISPVKSHLTPGWIRIYPLLSDICVKIGKPATGMLLSLVLDSDDDYLVKFATDSLVRIGEPVVPLVLARLDETNKQDLKVRLIDLIASLRAGKAVDKLATFLKARRSDTATAAQRALAAIATEKALTELGSCFDWAGSREQLAVGALFKNSQGPKFRVLCNLTKDERWRVRLGALRTLRMLGAACPPEVKSVVQSATKDKNRAVRKQAKKTLASLS